MCYRRECFPFEKEVEGESVDTPDSLKIRTARKDERKLGGYKIGRIRFVIDADEERGNEKPVSKFP